MTRLYNINTSFLLFLALLFLFASCNGNTTSPDTTEPLDVSNTVPLNENHRVIYELNLFNFTQEGTFLAAQNRLEELHTLGIDIVWLMPLQPRSKKGRIGSLGSPYALQDYTAVHPSHGSLDDMRNYVREAHRLGMEVWMDWVPNHTGLDHVWVTEHPEYYQMNGGEIVHPNGYGDVYQLDYGNPDMQQAMIDAMSFWLRETDIDGFRFDYISSPQIPASFWTKALPALQAINPDKRVWFLAEGDLADRKDLYPVGFDYDYAWAFHDRLARQLGTTNKGVAISNQGKLLVNNTNYDKMDRMVYLTNHDDGNDGKNYFSDFGINVPVLTVMEFTLYGMPLLYNGQEIGYRPVQDYFSKSVINWSNPNKQLQNTIATLIALRHTQPSMSSGSKTDRAEVSFLETDQPSVVCYQKKKGESVALVMLNLESDSLLVNLSGIEEGKYDLWLDSRTIKNGTSVTHTSLSANPAISIEAKGYRVWVKN